MANRFSDRLKHAWNAFTYEEESRPFKDSGPYSTVSFGNGRPDRLRLGITNERTIIASIYNRIGIDTAVVDIKHVRTDRQDRYLEDINSGLNDCLTVNANLDQASRAFKQDVVMTLLEKGSIAIIPVDTRISPMRTGGLDILSLRVGEIVKWHPDKVRVKAYNEKTGTREEVTLPKSMVAIVENPLYNVMNEPNSTLQRLANKLSLLDTVDQQSASGKLDLIMQLPYSIRSEARREQAERRAKDIEVQLTGSKYGVAYVDATEKITQLNRPVENQLQSQITSLTEMLYSQLGITPEVMNGTADEKVMINYYNRTVEPILAAVAEAMKVKFLTKTARSQGHSIMYFRDPFRLVPISQIADIADKFTRNEIATSNEIRTAIGWTPSEDPKADKLQNSNMPQQEGSDPPTEEIEPEVEIQNES